MLLIWLLACADKPAAPCLEGFERGDGGNCEATAAQDTGDDSAAPTDDTGGATADDTGADTAPAADDTGGSSSDDTGPDDTPPGLPQGFSSGDPIRTVDSVRPAIDDNPHNGYESVDTIILEDRYAMSVGQGGWVLTDLDSGALLDAAQVDRGYYITLDEESGFVWVSTRQYGIYSLNVNDLSNVTMERDTWRPSEGGYSEDISVQGGRMMVSSSSGVSFFEMGSSGRPDEVSWFPATQAVGAAIHGDRALFTDGYDLVLLDVSELADPAELDRVTLGGKGHDIAFDGQHVGVALGGYGFAVLDVEGDALIDRGDFETPGSCFSVALDGDYLWAAAWEQAVLAWAGEGDAVVLGHEPITEYGLGIAASNGRAAVADWFYVTTMIQEPEVGGPELDVSDKLTMNPEGDSNILTFRNAGAQTLEITLSQPDDEAFSITETELVIEPGRSAFTGVDFSGGQTSTELRYTSNDPDETSGAVILSSAQTSVGSPHPDMELLGILPPDDNQTLYNLQDQTGSVVLLVYFALY